MAIGLDDIFNIGTAWWNYNDMAKAYDDAGKLVTTGTDDAVNTITGFTEDAIAGLEGDFQGYQDWLFGTEGYWDITPDIEGGWGEGTLIDISDPRYTYVDPATGESYAPQTLRGGTGIWDREGNLLTDTEGLENTVDYLKRTAPRASIYNPDTGQYEDQFLTSWEYTEPAIGGKWWVEGEEGFLSQVQTIYQDLYEQGRTDAFDAFIAGTGTVAELGADTRQRLADMFGTTVDQLEDIFGEGLEAATGQFAPWLDAGAGALGDLQELDPFAFDYQNDYMNSNYFNWLMDQTTQGVERGAAAKSSLYSGNTLQDLNRDLSMVASQFYGDEWKRQFDAYGDQKDTLKYLSDSGLQAARDSGQITSDMYNQFSGRLAELTTAQAMNLTNLTSAEMSNVTSLANALGTNTTSLINNLQNNLASLDQTTMTLLQDLTAKTGQTIAELIQSQGTAIADLIIGKTTTLANLTINESLALSNIVSSLLTSLTGGGGTGTGGAAAGGLTLLGDLDPNTDDRGLIIGGGLDGRGQWGIFGDIGAILIGRPNEDVDWVEFFGGDADDARRGLDTFISSFDLMDINDIIGSVGYDPIDWDNLFASGSEFGSGYDAMWGDQSGTGIDAIDIAWSDIEAGGTADSFFDYIGETISNLWEFGTGAIVGLVNAINPFN